MKTCPAEWPTAGPLRLIQELGVRLRQWRPLRTCARIRVEVMNAEEAIHEIRLPKKKSEWKEGQALGCQNDGMDVARSILHEK